MFLKVIVADVEMFVSIRNIMAIAKTDVYHKDKSMIGVSIVCRDTSKLTKGFVHKDEFEKKIERD